MNGEAVVPVTLPVLPGEDAVAVGVLRRLPSPLTPFELRSACVTVYEAVKVMASPGANVSQIVSVPLSVESPVAPASVSGLTANTTEGWMPEPSCRSASERFVSVWLPEFVTMKV